LASTGRPEPRLRALTVQLVETGDGVLVKRGATEIVVAGTDAKEIVQTIVLATSGDGATREQICDLFAPLDRSAVGAFLEELVTRRILVPSDTAEPPSERPESELEVFYWQFGFRFRDVMNELRTKRIAVIGVNTISRRLALSLVASGMPGQRLEVVDFLLLRNLRLFDRSGVLRPPLWPSELGPPIPYEDWSDGLDASTLSCVVATSDFGGMHLLRQWNEFCVEERRVLLPVVLQDFVGYVGPLVVPGETACYECLRGRQNANMQDPEAQRLPERLAFQGQLATAFHPAMASVLGDIAAMELLKFFTAIPVRWAGTLFEVNLLQPAMVGRKVLKLPRCPVCSPLNRLVSFTPHVDEYMHERQ
jgi:molybdopterin-synthase adenylyltransferase